MFLTGTGAIGSKLFLAGAPVGGELFGVGGALLDLASCHGAACSGVLWRSLDTQASAGGCY